MNGWKPGDVAMVLNEHGVWNRAIYVVGNFWQYGVVQSVTPGTTVHVRPLVVIDPESAEDVERLWGALGDHGVDLSEVDLAAALREFAAPTPPRPDEPQGLGAVVEDAAGGRWVRTHMPLDAHWRSADFQGNYRPWGALDVVRVLSEGVS